MEGIELNVIEVKDLKKQFKVKEKEKGIKGSLKSILKDKFQIKFCIVRNENDMHDKHLFKIWL